MKYLLDFNVISALFDNESINHDKIVEKFENLDDDNELYLSVLTLFEFEYSFFCCVDVKKQAEIRSTIETISSDLNKIGITEAESKIFGEIKSLIKNVTKKKPENMRKLNIDIMIASSALSNSCVVVSGDKIFKTISEVYPQAKFENWLE